eukprot:713684-Hanusia_phi.AAC.1
MMGRALVPASHAASLACHVCDAPCAPAAVPDTRIRRIQKGEGRFIAQEAVLSCRQASSACNQYRTAGKAYGTVGPRKPRSDDRVSVFDTSVPGLYSLVKAASLPPVRVSAAAAAGCQVAKLAPGARPGACDPRARWCQTLSPAICTNVTGTSLQAPPDYPSRRRRDPGRRARVVPAAAGHRLRLALSPTTVTACRTVRLFRGPGPGDFRRGAAAPLTVSDYY